MCLRKADQITPTRALVDTYRLYKATIVQTPSLEHKLASDGGKVGGEEDFRQDVQTLKQNTLPPQGQEECQHGAMPFLHPFKMAFLLKSLFQTLPCVTMCIGLKRDAQLIIPSICPQFLTNSSLVPLAVWLICLLRETVFETN